MWVVYIDLAEVCFFFLSNFSCRFLNPNNFSNLNYNCSNLLDLRNLQNKLRKHSVTKNYSDLSLFEEIVLVISKNFQILGLQPRISKVFLIIWTIFSHSKSEQFWQQNTILFVCPVQRLESFVSNYIMFFWLTIVQFAIKRCLNLVLSNKSYHRRERNAFED